MKADIITYMANDEGFGRGDGTNSRTIIWVTENNNWRNQKMLAGQLGEVRTDLHTRIDFLRNLRTE